MQLRDYQQAAIDCAFNWMRVHQGNPAIVIPTAGGKSPTMASMARTIVEQWGGRVGIIAHTEELVGQNFAKLRQIWPDAPAGVYAAGLRRKDRFDKILSMQMQSCYKRMHEFGKFDMLLIDEAHRIPLESDGMYRQLINGARKFNPDVRVCGYTATPYRLQGRAVPVCGPDYILNDVCYEVGVAELIERGFLSRLVSKRGLASVDASEAKKRGGEYIESELAKITDKPDIVDAACREIIALAENRKAIIVFCCTIEHAEHVRDKMRELGETAEMLHGKTPKAERKDIINRHQRGEFRVIANVNVLSEGYDAPHIDCVAMLRATLSPGLYYQQVGRGLRLSPGKADCLVLDFAGNITAHGPLDEIKVSRPRNGKAAEVRTGLVRTCLHCQTHVPITALVCPECGYNFPPAAREVNHLTSPTGAAILAAQRVPVWRDVEDVSYMPHVGASGIEIMKVTYYMQMGMYSVRDWVGFEHQGYAQNKARSWWQARAKPGCEHVPATVAQAVERASAGEIKIPTRLLIDDAGKYPEIKDYDYSTIADRVASDAIAVPAGPAEPSPDKNSNDNALRGMHALLRRIKGVSAA